MTKVLIVEDDRALAEVLAYNLKKDGYEVFVAYDGRDGLQQAEVKTPDLIILDLMLPVIDGLEVCRRLRSNSATKEAIILMLTAKAEETDQVVGFSLGADDYVTKPFSVKVLVERIKALQRRRRGEAEESEEQTTMLGIVVDSRDLELTRSEFRLLDTLIRQPGRVFRRSELIDAALGEDTMVLERTIDVHIRGLRRKLGAACNAVETVRGVGYRFSDRAMIEAE
jgi:DNA-binding response OmpR family regulator